MDRYLARTPLLDADHPAVEALFTERDWDRLGEEARARAVYEFVRDEIPFGYNRDELIPASRVLAEGRGPGLAKGTLLMALLRRAGIPCRFHAFTVSRQVLDGVLLEGLLEGLPDNVPHCTVETLIADRWITLEGFIVDTGLLASVQARFADRSRDFCGYAVATDDLQAPPRDWSGDDTFVQHRAIMGDLGVFVSPDAFHARYPEEVLGLTGPRWRLLYHTPANRNLDRLRAGDYPPDAERFAGTCPRGLLPRG